MDTKSFFRAVEAKDWKSAAMFFRVMLQPNSLIFFCVCKNCVDGSCSLSPIHWTSNSINGSLPQRRFLSVQNIWSNWFFTLVSVSKKINCIWTLLCVANPPRALKLHSTKVLGLELKKWFFSQVGWSCYRRWNTRDNLCFGVRFV